MALLLATPASAASGLVIERIVAVVEDRVVLLSEVESVVDDIMRAEPPPAGMDPDAYRKSRRAEVLDTLIAEKLLEQEIKKLRIEVSDAEVERIIEGTKQQNNLDDKKLKQALAQQGLTLAEYREGLKKQLMKAKIIQLKVKNRVQVTDQDVKSVYAQRQALNATDYRVRARHILFLVPKGSDAGPAKKKADAALARLKTGADFAKLAAEVSEGPSAKKGGALGVFGRGEMVPEFERAAFAAEPGKVVGPVRSPFGWHLILVDERVASSERPLDQVEDELRNRLYEEEVERVFRSYIEDLKKHAHIEIRD
jgi:peptidyl-prolyl cis-trans isomerase SurA